MELNQANTAKPERDKSGRRKSPTQLIGDKSPRENSQSSEASQSDFSFSISVTPPLLPEYNTKVPSASGSVPKEPSDDSVTISENIEEDNFSNTEKDRSFHEIEIVNTSREEENGTPKVPEHSLREASETDSFNIAPESSKNSEFSEKRDDNVVNIPVFPQPRTNASPILSPVRLSLELDYANLVGLDMDDLDSAHNMNSLNNKVQDVLNEILKSDKSSKLSQINTPDSSNSHTSPRLAVEHSLSKIKDLEELLVSKDEALAALTSELDSLKQASGNLSTFSNTTTTEYKALADSYQLRLLDFQNELTNRDNIIQQLSDSLEQSVVTRQQLQEQGDQLVNEVVLLRAQLSETTRLLESQQWNTSSANVTENTSNENEIAKYHPQPPSSAITDIVVEARRIDLNKELDKLQATLNPNQLHVFNDFKIALNIYVSQQLAEMKATHANEFKIQLDKFDSEKMEHTTEVNRLRELLSTIKCGSTEIMELRKELEAKHAHEMGQLRMYFEKKCADLEKHYSEEVFSQQSRRISDGSSCSESEMASDVLFSGPPALPTIGPASDHSGRYKKDVASNSPAGDANPNRFKKDNSPVLSHKLESLKMELEMQRSVELDIIRNDYENKVEDIMRNNDNVMQTLETKYVEQIESLKNEVESLKAERANPVESASASEEELAEVVLSYERRLHEQVEMAKHDMIMALETQIQTLLENNGEDSKWPSEFLQLRHIFTQRYEAQMAMIKMQHAAEVAKLKEDHERYIVRSAEREKRRSKEYETQQSSDTDSLVVLNERDNLKKTNIALLQIIRELGKYVTICEDEVNNTIVGELLKEDETETPFLQLNESNATDGSDLRVSLNSSQILKMKRVHFAPDMSNIITFVDEDSMSAHLDSTQDISTDLRNELQTCLERLKAEASEILLVSSNLKSSTHMQKTHLEVLPKENPSLMAPVDAKLGDSEMAVLLQMKNTLTEELVESRNLVKTLELERASLETQLSEVIEKQNNLVVELDAAKQKIVELITENGQKEIISEGYGESDIPTLAPLESPRETLAQALERARAVLEEEGDGVEHAEMLALIESLCRAAQRTQEDAKRDTHDLQLQVEAADKKLRATVKFLEEQASEREAERDEAQRQLQTLQTQLAQKERECLTAQHIANEVEQLEHQMREMSVMMADGESKKLEVENELKEAVDKVWVLRDIIRDLESQVEAKTEAEYQLQKQVEDLTSAVKQQHRNNEQLTHEIDSLKSLPDNNQILEHADHLEQELAEFRQFGTAESLQQMRVQLEEIITLVYKKTKDLEMLHTSVSNTSCSSPSEDISAAEKVPKVNLLKKDVVVEPLEIVQRLESALQRHTRVEGAAVKKIKDLDMQSVKSKSQFEDLQTERDALLERLAEQLTDISSLQMRLEEQRHLVQTVTKQSNMSLENKVYDLENEIRDLKDTLIARDKQIKQLENILDKTMKRLKDTEKELSHNSDNEKEVVDKLKSEISELQTENKTLKSKLEKEAANRKIVPEIIDTLLADKNKELDSLAEELQRKDRDLEFYHSLQLDKEQLRELSLSHKEHSEGKSSARTLSDVVSISEYDAPDLMIRKEASQSNSLHSLDHAYAHNPNETPLLPAHDEPSRGEPFNKVTFDSAFMQPDMSSIPFLELKDIDVNDHSEKSPKSLSEKRVHFCDDDIIANYKAVLAEMREQLNDKDCKLQDFTEQLNLLPALQVEMSQLQSTLDEINEEKQQIKEQFETIKIAEITLKTELDDMKLAMKEKNKQVNVLTDDVKRRDDMFINSTKEKQDLQNVVADLEERLLNLQDVLIPEKDATIEILEKKINTSMVSNNSEEQMASKQKELDDLRSLFENLEMKYEANMVDFEKSQTKNQELKKVLALKSDEIKKLQSDFDKKCVQCDNLSDELINFQLKVEEKNKKVQDLQATSVNPEIVEQKNQEIQKYAEEVHVLREKVTDRECEIEIMNEDINKFHEDIASLQNQLRETQSLNGSGHLNRELKAKDKLLLRNKTESEELHKEITHLQDYLKEKDNIIHQMSEDSKSLRNALESIQNKMKETGNIVDLTKKYKEEQCLSTKLQEEIHMLRLQIDRLENTSPKGKEFELLDDITGQVQRELDYSALLDSNILSAIENNESLPAEKALRNDSEKSDGKNNPSNSFDKPSLEVEKLQAEKATLTDDLIKKNVHNQELAEINEAIVGELKILKEKFEIERENCMKLQSLLDEEKQNSNEIQMQDANIIEKMRIRLETALDTEMELELVIEKERKIRNDLNAKLKELQERLESPLNPENIMKESYDNELQKLCEDNQRLLRENQDTNKLVNDKEDEVATLKAKYSSLKYDFENFKLNKSAAISLEDMHKIDQVVEENVKLKIEMAELRNRLTELTSQLGSNTEVLKIRQGELEELHRQTELYVEEKMLSKQKERKTMQSRQLENSRELLCELDQDKKMLEAQVKELKTELKLSREQEMKLTELLAKEREEQLKSPVPTKFLQKLQELKNLLASHVKENKKMTETVGKLTDERRELQAQVKELGKLRSKSSPDHETEERYCTLFGKYLRVESFRKSLAWQKHYLLAVVYSYEAGKKSRLLPENGGKKHRDGSSKKSFRVVAQAVVAMLRMQFLVRRWSTGVRIAGRAWCPNKGKPVLSTSPTPSSGSSISAQQSMHHGNQTQRDDSKNISGIRFELNTPMRNPGISNSWSGASPPCRDIPRWDFHNMQQMQPISTEQHLSSLRAPYIIAQYVDRFDQIQQRLGLALQSPPP